MTGWILFASTISLIAGLVAGAALGFKTGVMQVGKMLVKGDITVEQIKEKMEQK